MLRSRGACWTKKKESTNSENPEYTPHYRGDADANTRIKGEQLFAREFVVRLSFAFDANTVIASEGGVCNPYR